MERVFRRIDLHALLADVSAEEREGATEAARARDAEVYRQLTYTEGRPEWVLLYEHIQRGQIDPNLIRRMATADLRYVAGHSQMHPELLNSKGTAEEVRRAQGRAMKAVENGARASWELQRRAMKNAYLWTTAVAASLGGAAGAILARVLDQ